MSTDQAAGFPMELREAAWRAVTNRLAAGDAISLGDLVEETLATEGERLEAPGDKDHDAASLRKAIGQALEADDRYVQVRPGYWCERSAIPRPPARLRLPTIRMEGAEPVLVEAYEAFRQAVEAEAPGRFVRRLSYREIAGGYLALGPVAERLMPDAPNSQIHLSLPEAGAESIAWVTREPRPLLYGLDDWLWQYMPGQYLEFTRIESHRFAVTVQQRFDAAYYRSESRLFDLEELRRLRRFGLTYRQHIQLVLARHPGGLDRQTLLAELEKELGFRPNPGTISALLSASSEFELQGGNRGNRWVLVAGAAGTSWHADAARALAWAAEEGERFCERQVFEAAIVSLGGTPEAILASLRHSRPDGICFFASSASQGLVDEVMAKLGSPPAWFERVIVPHHEDLSGCIATGHQALAVVRRHGVTATRTLVDITGGTKVMAAGLAIAAYPTGCTFSYVGGLLRTKNQLGVVESGHEVVRILS